MEKWESFMQAVQSHPAKPLNYLKNTWLSLVPAVIPKGLLVGVSVDWETPGSCS